MVNEDFFKSTYNNKRVFVTGHTGFKGSWLISWLKLLGADIKGYSLAPQHPDDLYNSINGDKLCQSVVADIREKELLKKEILNYQPDFIFHLAAQPLVRFSYEIPAETFEINALGTAYVLDALRELVKPCISIFITTDKVYENKEWHYPYRETDRLGGHDPYSASKATAELIINSYRSSYFGCQTFDNHQKSIAVARAGNVIGGGDWSADRIIPDAIRALMNNQPIIVRNPDSIRPWQHVLEPLSGYLLLGCLLTRDPIKFCGAWNFGPSLEDTLTVRELVELVIKVWGGGTYETSGISSRLHEAKFLKLDINNSVNELKWFPKWSSKRAIEKTLEWYSSLPENRVGILHAQIKEIYDF